MKTSLTKSAIVTGASGGIGRVVAKRLASDGFAITVHYSGNPAKAETVVAEIDNAGGKAIAVQADVAKAADVENLFKKTLEAFDKVDVVVHSAGSTCVPSNWTFRRKNLVTQPSRRSLPRTVASTWSFTTPDTWFLVRPKRSRPNNSLSCMTSTS